MDGVDAALVCIDPHDPSAPPRIEQAQTMPFPNALIDALEEAKQWVESDHHDFMRQPACALLDQSLAATFAEAALGVVEAAKLSMSDVTAIGSHGQTLSHRPQDVPPLTLQLGNPQTIANLSGCPTVGRFRQADLDAGGQGAPLAPLLHQQLLAHPTETRAVLNLGGIANVTLLVPDQPIMGFDTGPANGLLDRWYQRHHQKAGSARFDVSGAWARQGQACASLLGRLMDDPFFEAPPPKSTSIEYFGEQWLDQRLRGFESLAPVDVQACLIELTTQTVVQALRQASVGAHPMDRLIVCGGGVHNQTLMTSLKEAVPETAVTQSDDLGVSSDHLEAMLFAWLAHQRLNEVYLDTTTITGSSQPVRLGDIYHPCAT